MDKPSTHKGQTFEQQKGLLDSSDEENEKCAEELKKKKRKRKSKRPVLSTSLLKSDEESQLFPLQDITSSNAATITNQIIPIGRAVKRKLPVSTVTSPNEHQSKRIEEDDVIKLPENVSPELDAFDLSSFTGVDPVDDPNQVLEEAQEVEDKALEALVPFTNYPSYSCYFMVSEDDQWLYFGTLTEENMDPCMAWKEAEESTGLYHLDCRHDETLTEDDIDGEMAQLLGKNNYTSEPCPADMKFRFIGRTFFRCDAAGPDYNATMDCAEFYCAYRHAVLLMGSVRYPALYKKSYNKHPRDRGFRKSNWEDVKASLLSAVENKEDPFLLEVPMKLCNSFDAKYVSFEFEPNVDGVVTESKHSRLSRLGKVRGMYFDVDRA